mgnify:FL=1
MASGDVINGFSPVGAILDFQPAAGVEIVVKTCFLNGVSNAPSLTNGTIESNMSTSNTAISGTSLSDVNIFINNTNYLRINSLGGGQYSAFSGIQIK